MRSILIPAILLFVVPPAGAMHEMLVNDYKSSINFSVRATGHTVEGHVTSFSSRIHFASQNDFPQFAEIRFETADLTTEHEERDREMLNWLESEKYPEVFFEMEKVVGTGNTRVVEGSLTLHGVTRGVSIPVTITSKGPFTTITGETEIETRNFRLPKFRRALIMSVSPTVRIEFDLVGKIE
jgi:polyisoprenoid-binding protein YceI